jgi:PhnB protein
MSRVNTYLNFPGTTEEAFTLYASLFSDGASFSIQRFSEQPGMPPMSEEDGNKVLHAELPILNGHILMATDMLTSLGHECKVGNNTTISLELDSRDEAQRLYDALSQDSTETAPMAEMPWGQFWGCTLDRFGIRWMFSSAL